MSALQSTSSSGIAPWEKIRELWGILRLYQSARTSDSGLEWIFRDCEEYASILARYVGRNLNQTSALEIGFGARPLRLETLRGLGTKIVGVDIDIPLITGRLSEILEIWKRNGVERAIKSLVRFWLFDRSERSALVDAVRVRGGSLCFSREGLYCGDAADLEFEPHSFDWILSEDVFEHIPVTSLRKLIPKMARWLAPNGVALIRPNIFTGISGGHLVEWFPRFAEEERKRQSEPWEHLRKRRFAPNTFLNELSRSSYRRLFSPWFSVVEERVRYPKLGQRWLTPAVRSELQGYSEDELFSNAILFVLRPIGGRGRPSQEGDGTSPDRPASC